MVIVEAELISAAIASYLELKKGCTSQMKCKENTTQEWEQERL